MENDLDMSNEWRTFTSTALTEIRRRAATIEMLAEVAPTPVASAQRYAWNNGGGDCAVWYFLDDRAMLLTYDHEAELNLYGDYDFDTQLSFFDGVPADLRSLVLNQPENYETLNIESEDGKSVFTAGGVFWFDGQRWQVSNGLKRYCAERSIDVLNESGFGFTTHPYLFGRPLTAETIVADRCERGWYQTEAEQMAALAQIGDRLSEIERQLLD